MTATRDVARRLLERTGEHPVVSLYLDLDPERFATPPARATQARSLLDQAGRARQSDPTLRGLDHDDRAALDDDLERLERYLSSDEPPVAGARALAVFCSGRDQLFEAVPLAHPAETQVVIARTPHVEPLVGEPEHGAWCVTLINRREARIFEGDADQLSEREHVSDDVHGQHSQGGFSQARYQRSYEQDVDGHLRHAADQLTERFGRRPFATLVLGGPSEVVSRFEDQLPGELRDRVAAERLELDVAGAERDAVRAAIVPLLAQRDRSRERHALEELSSRLGSHGAASAGTRATLEALLERRVQTLVLSRGFDGGGARCPTCGLLSAERGGSCPADGSTLEPVADLREAAIEAGVMQDADLVVVDEGDPERDDIAVPGGEGIAALLRF